MVPEHVDEVFAAVVVVKQRRIEAAAVEIDRVGPLAVDARAGDEVIVEVAQRTRRSRRLRTAAVAFHVGVNQPEQSVGVREARRPDAAGIGIAEHVELAGAIERAREQPPVNEVARMVNLHAGKPFERRGGDVVIVADADDGRVGIEAGQDGIANRRSGFRHGRLSGRKRCSRGRIAHQCPEDGGAHEIQHAETHEERSVADGGEHADTQIALIRGHPGGAGRQRALDVAGRGLAGRDDAQPGDPDRAAPGGQRGVQGRVRGLPGARAGRAPPRRTCP